LHKRKNAFFAGNDGGAVRWAIAMTLIITAKLNGIEPLAWLTDVLERLVSGGIKQNEIEQLLPWNWRPPGAGRLSSPRRPTGPMWCLPRRQMRRPAAAVAAMRRPVRW
jgi:hypothetical protein